MGVLGACFLVFLIHGALSAPRPAQTEEDLLHACSKTDIECLSESARDFLERTSAGIKAFDILPIDPWKKALIEIPMENGVAVNMRNVTINGLKRLKINDFKIDSVKRSVFLEMKDEADILADLQVVEGDNTGNDEFDGTGVTIVQARYTYDLVTNEKGDEYFVVGPEALSCSVETQPNVTLNKDVAKKLWNDKNANEVQSLLICKIIEEAYKDVIHNLRSSAKLYPKKAYFTDL